MNRTMTREETVAAIRAREKEIMAARIENMQQTDEARMNSIAKEKRND